MKTFITASVLAAAVVSAAGAATSTLTLATNATVVTYGKAATLTGQLSPAKTNQNVSVNGTACGTTRAAKVTTAKTAANGTYTAAVTPAVTTKYEATYKGGVKSPTVTISVKPLLQLAKVAGGGWTAKVTAGQSLTGKYVLFQRYVKLTKRWKQVKRLALGTAAPGPAKPTMVMTTSFKAKVVRGARVRLAMSAAQAAPCYLAATSASLRA